LIGIESARRSAFRNYVPLAEYGDADFAELGSRRTRSKKLQFRSLDIASIHDSAIERSSILRSVYLLEPGHTGASLLSSGSPELFVRLSSASEDIAFPNWMWPTKSPLGNARADTLRAVLPLVRVLRHEFADLPALVDSALDARPPQSA